MPLYDYACEACGEFRAWQPMSQSMATVDCPTCGDPAMRSVAAPFIASMNPNTRIAHQRNEKSAHEPQVMSHVQLERTSVKRSHALGHHHHGDCSAKGGPREHRSSRPWMIGH